MLMRFDPFREVDRLTEAMLERAGVPRMPMDAYRHGDSFLVHFDLPGIDPGSIEVTVEKNVLAVKAERGSTQTEQDEVVVAERPQGTFSRQVFLGEGLDPEHIEARYDGGVLTLTIPVAEQAKPRRVEIASGQSNALLIETAARSIA
jgi:HSP20 family protein